MNMIRVPLLAGTNYYDSVLSWILPVPQGERTDILKSHSHRFLIISTSLTPIFPIPFLIFLFLLLLLYSWSGSSHVPESLSSDEYF